MPVSTNHRLIDSLNPVKISRQIKIRNLEWFTKVVGLCATLHTVTPRIVG